MTKSEFTSERSGLHLRMAEAYHKFLTFLFVENADDNALRESMNETCIKFLTSYFICHAPIAPIFGGYPKLAQRQSMDRRYLIADYYSEEALRALQTFPKPRKHLRFEHVLPKDRLRTLCETKIADPESAFGVDDIKELLDESWHVAVVLATEDQDLKPAKDMPPGWRSGDDVFARYRGSDGETHFRLYRALEDLDQCRQVFASTAEQQGSSTR
jgi:hypothetical protein